MELKNQVKVPNSPSPPFPIYWFWYSVKQLLHSSLGITIGPINGIFVISTAIRSRNLCFCPLCIGKKMKYFLSVRHSKIQNFCNTKSLALACFPTEAPDMRKSNSDVRYIRALFLLLFRSVQTPFLPLSNCSHFLLKES